jgi:hypothetical protein
MSDQAGIPVPWSLPLVGRAIFAAGVCLLTGAVAGYAVSHERGPDRAAPPASSSVQEGAPGGAPRTTPSPAGPAELALVAPLAPGAELEGYTVKRIDAVFDGTVGVLLERGPDRVRLDVAMAGPDSASGNRVGAAAGTYAVYDRVEGAPTDDGERVAKALARILADGIPRPAPPGLAPLREEAR